MLRDETLGKEHPDTLRTLNNLALVLTDRGNYKEAERIYRQVLALRNETLGQEHPDTLGSMNNLASVLTSQCKNQEAEQLNRQVFILRDKILGPQHPETLGTLNNLAVVLKNQARYDEAEHIYRQTLESQETVLGREHPLTLMTLSNLASVLNQLHKFEHTEQIYREVLVIMERVLGNEHPHTLNSIDNLALVLSSQGKFEEAETIHRQALVSRETILGRKHPDTQVSLRNLVSLLNSRGRHEEAERVSRQTLVHGKALEASFDDLEAAFDPDAASDNESLPSIFSDSASASSQSSAEELLSAANEFAALLISNEILDPLCKQAVKSDSIGPERFGRNFSRLLRTYSKELKHDAQNRIQDSAARLIRSRADYISHVIRAHYDHDYRTMSKHMKDLDHQTPDHARRERLEQYLVQIGTEDPRMQAAEPEAIDRQMLRRISTAIPTRAIEEDGESSHSEDNQVQVDLPTLAQVEAFLVSGGAFRNLLKNFQVFVQPVSEIGTIVPNGEESDTKNRIISALSFHFERCSTAFKMALLQLHLNVLNRLNGYLEPPLDRGKIRVRWTCKCGRRLWDDFQELRPGAAEDLRKKLDYHEMMSTRLHQVIVGDAEGTHSPLSRNPVSLPMQHLAHPPRITPNMHFMHHAGTPIGRMPATDTAPDPHDPRTLEMNFLLLCFQKPSDTLRLFQLDLQHTTDDFELFKMLRETYRSHRGILARMFSLRKVVSVNFKKVNEVSGGSIFADKDT
ncbi:MAG: hypothetical protein Q9164_006864 [Protoblastenia rupestris]